MVDESWHWLEFDPLSSRLAKGELLFEQGGEIQNMYLISHGRVKLFRHSADGEITLLHVAVAGEMIAEASLFSDHYHCNAIADRPCEIRSIRREIALKQVLDDPQGGQEVLALFSRQIRDLRGLIETRNIRSAGQRILAFLKSIADSDGKAMITFPVRDMAYKLGLAHETVYRELRQLEKNGSLKRQGSGVFYL